MTAPQPQWEIVKIAQGKGPPEEARMYRLGDWAVARTSWGTTITHVPTGRTIGHHYNHHDTE